MKVNKKRLAEIFNVDPRTIERWQSQGLPCASKGSKGIESVFDTAMAIQWYAQRETDIENEKLRKELDDLVRQRSQIYNPAPLTMNATGSQKRRQMRRN